MADFYIRSLPLLCKTGTSPRCFHKIDAVIAGLEGCWQRADHGTAIHPENCHFATLPLCHIKEVANVERMARVEGNIIRILLYYNIIIF